MTKKEKWIKIRIAEDVDWIEFQNHNSSHMKWSVSFIISFTWYLLCQGTLGKKTVDEAWGVVTFLEMPYKWEKNYHMSTNV